VLAVGAVGVAGVVGVVEGTINAGII